jgi:hypothetical protein
MDFSSIDWSRLWQNIPFPWALIIGLAVLAFGYLIEHFFEEIFEDHEFFLVIFIFLVIYVGAAFAINFLNPFHLTAA